MKDDVHNRQHSVARMQDAEVRRLAQKAIGVLATAGSAASDVMRDRLEMLCDAFLAPDGERRHDALARIREDGISGRDVIDHVIPETARLLGERWFADEISFADVTIGTARLQESVRALASRDHTGSRGMAVAHDAPEILLILPRGEDHSLGIFVAADQFRRMGYRVEVALDQHPREVRALIKRRRFVMVGITVSGRRTLASARNLVEGIRTTVTHVTPTVIGGTVLETGADVLAATGADHIATDARAALRACHLSLALAETRKLRLGRPQDDDGHAATVKGDTR